MKFVADAFSVLDLFLGFGLIGVYEMGIFLLILVISNK